MSQHVSGRVLLVTTCVAEFGSMRSRRRLRRRVSISCGRSSGCPARTTTLRAALAGRARSRPGRTTAIPGTGERGNARAFRLPVMSASGSTVVGVTREHRRCRSAARRDRRRLARCCSVRDRSPVAWTVLPVWESWRVTSSAGDGACVGVLCALIHKGHGHGRSGSLQGPGCAAHGVGGGGVVPG
jgi:hypothetical protein